MKVLILPRKTLAQVREDFVSAGYYRNPEFLSQSERPTTTPDSAPARFRFEERAHWLGGLETISQKGEVLPDAATACWRVRRFLQEEEASTRLEPVFSREAFPRVQAIRHDHTPLEDRCSRVILE